MHKDNIILFVENLKETEFEPDILSKLDDQSQFNPEP
jgi:hypothetical protein